MNSVLNPEAPEFYPHIASFTQVHTSYMPPIIYFCVEDYSAQFVPYAVSPHDYEAYTSLNKTIRSSNSFPSGASYDFFKTFTDFNIVTCQLSESVIVKSNEILITEMPSVKLTQKDLNYNTEIIVDANDRMLDRIEINMDSLNQVNTVSDQLQDGMKPGCSVSNWNNNLVIAKIQVGSTMFIGAKNIPRPQLTFKDPVDNSDSLWVPKISDKPNNIKPLALNIIYNDEGEAVGYEHPYKVEIDLYAPPQVFIDPDPEPPSFPPPMQQTKFTYIDTESQVDELVEHLSTVQELAVDVEHHSYRTYQGITCLIQISTNEGGDFIIDTLAVREHIHKLNLSFTDPKKLKVLHGAEMDVIWLQRDFGVYIVGLFDTYLAAKTLAMNGLSLKHLLMKYCEVNADKKYQLADWRMRPLPDELIEYARQDTHYLLYVWRRMKADLLAAAGGADNLLRSVFNNSKFVCSTTYKKVVVDDSSHMPLYVRSKRAFDSRQMAALKMLYKWRDVQARQLDESTSYLLPNHMLLTLAGTLPREVQGVNACCNPMPPFVKQNLITIHRMLLTCRELPLEPLPYSLPSSSATRPSFPRRPTVGYDMHDLSDFPKLMKDDEITLDKPKEIINEINDNKPRLSAIIPDEEKKADFVSTLNVDAQMYIPPYYRYRGYRFLAKEEELKEIENKEAKVTAIAQGDPLIKAEVLDKLQVSKTAIEKQEKTFEEPVFVKPIQRKRKMSSEKPERKNEPETQKYDNKPSSSGVNKLKAKSDAQNVKPFKYQEANYKNLYNDREQMRKQAKMKFTKHK